jgi:putative MATE family efflux protein
MNAVTPIGASPIPVLAGSTMTEAAPQPMSPRTSRLLQGPIIPIMLAMAWPNVLVMLAQASTGLIETWFVSRLGLEALTGMALVFPGFMMMQMLSGGAMGGGISSAIARALGGGRKHDADALVWHAVIINVALGVTFSALVLTFGRSLYQSLGGSGESLELALRYSNIVFLATPLVWLMNGLASIIRGTGNMAVPALAVCLGVALLIPLSPTLIFGLGPIPAMGVAGAGIAVLITTASTTLLLGCYVFGGWSMVSAGSFRPRRSMFGDILRVGAVASVSSLQTSLTIALLTALVGTAAGPDALAGYGTGARLEFLLVPLVFGLGAPLVALVGTNIGAGQRERALRIALTGGAVAFGLCETIGVAAAIWPEAWLGLFGHDPRMIATGVIYLHWAGPAYGFFGLGLSFYFSSQGAGRLAWPLFAGFLRMAIAIGGGWAAWLATHDLRVVFAVLTLALTVYGCVLLVAIGSGGWFRGGVPVRRMIRPPVPSSTGP